MIRRKGKYNKTICCIFLVKLNRKQTKQNNNNFFFLKKQRKEEKKNHKSKIKQKRYKPSPTHKNESQRMSKPSDKVFIKFLKKKKPNKNISKLK